LALEATNNEKGKNRTPMWYIKLRSPWVSAFMMILPALVLFAVFYFYPLIKMLPQSILEGGKFTLQYYKNVFTEPMYLETLFRTIWISLAATGINLLLGYAVAYTLLIVKPKTANMILALIMLSMWTSLLARTYSWMVVLQRTGIVNQILLRLGIISKSITIMYTPTAVLIGMVNILLPYMIMPIYSVLRGIDPNLSLAASSLGASKTKVFLKVTLPLSIPGIASGVLLVFIQSLGFYVTPMLLGGAKVMMVSGLIDMQMFAFLNWSFGSAIGVVLLFITVIFLAIFDHYFGMNSLQKRLV
jgi:putative spermidine/putrescine transport system permease protein